MTIQRYLLIIILSIVTLASFGSALKGYRASMAQLNTIFDRELHSFATALISSPMQAGIKREPLSSGLVYQIWHQGSLQLKSKNAPDNIISTQSAGYSEQTFHGNRWRVFVASTAQSKVIVAQSMIQRVESAEKVLLEAILPIVYSIPIIGLLVFLAIKKSLKPLSRLSTQLTLKSASDLSAITINENSAELKPIEDTVNSLLSRLANSFEREKRLSADAAHELRTPISVLTITAHNITKAFNDHTIKSHHIDELNNNVARMAHVIEQIIALNRTSPENFIKLKKNIDLEVILQKVIVDNFEHIEQAKQTISLQAQQVNVCADEFSLMILFDNLLKNANKYGGKDAEIQVTLIESLHSVSITVEDSGIGIPNEHLDKVFQRFYRINTQKEIMGSGLGLSIVKHIVNLHQGEIIYGPSDLGGFKVNISLPKTSNETPFL